MGRKKEIQNLEEKVRLIGIGGTNHCVGCTHFAIMMANYLAGYRRRKTALLEWNRSGDFEKLEIVCTGRVRMEKRFCILEADFYKAAGPKELAMALQSNYDDILIDFGVLEEDRISEFLRCERQFVIGSFSEWQEEAFREFVRKHETEKRSWNYLAVFGSEEARRAFKWRPGIAAGRIPYSADAFSVTKESCRFFEQLI